MNPFDGIGPDKNSDERILHNWYKGEVQNLNPMVLRVLAQFYETLFPNDRAHIEHYPPEENDFPLPGRGGYWRFQRSLHSDTLKLPVTWTYPGLKYCGKIRGEGMLFVVVTLRLIDPHTQHRNLKFEISIKDGWAGRSKSAWAELSRDVTEEALIEGIRRTYEHFLRRVAISNELVDEDSKVRQCEAKQKWVIEEKLRLAAQSQQMQQNALLHANREKKKGNIVIAGVIAMVFVGWPLLYMLIKLLHWL